MDSELSMHGDPSRRNCKNVLTSLIIVVLGSVLLSSCVAGHRPAFSRADQLKAVIPQIPSARFWSDSLNEDPNALPPFKPGERVTVLSLSGGADDGAYGAGFLNGWTQAGTRPEFNIVTGVSTGSLIAPFVFLGSAYDTQVTAAYTQTSPREIYHTRFLLSIPFSTSVATTKPLANLIRSYYSDAIIDKVAEQHRRGRRLFVGTTNLDAQRDVIWNMGAIASSSSPSRYVLFRKVILASSSVPGMFPPVLFNVESNGQTFRELHVDGGAIAGLLSIPPSMLAAGRAAANAPHAVLYLMVNNRLGGDFGMTKLAILDIVKRSFAIQVQSALLAGVTAAHLYMQKTGGDYFLTYIDDHFTVDERGSFDPSYMRALYSYGLERGKAGAWVSQPPTGNGMATAARTD